MNKLSTSERAHILQLLCEGMSIRAIERTTGSSKHTISRLLNDAGRILGAYQDEVFRELPCKRVQAMRSGASSTPSKRTSLTPRPPR